MVPEIPYVLLLLLIVTTAAGAVLLRGWATSVVLLSIFSLFTTVAYAMLQAVDVAMAEAAIGAGLMTAVFMTTVQQLRSRR
ncbi:MAG: hydrogenase subunit MbhD domain-containing protein [Alkalispirochaetaceae bacterium]